MLYCDGEIIKCWHGDGEISKNPFLGCSTIVAFGRVVARSPRTSLKIIFQM